VNQTDIVLGVGFVTVVLLLVQIAQKLDAIHAQLAKVNHQIWESRPVQDRVYGKQS
jgi:hypothetical protein